MDVMSDGFRMKPSDLSLTITEEELGNMEKNIKSESMNQRCIIVRCGHWEETSATGKSQKSWRRILDFEN